MLLFACKIINRSATLNAFLMSRKFQDKINSDREIIDLRMQSEDLINAMERMTEDEFRKESQRIADAIDARIECLFRESESL